MRLLKKYPNRRLYDTKGSVYVTLEDVRQMVLANESIKVVDSKSGNDLTRSVLLQIIAEQEGEGHEPLLTNRVLQQLIRFYGNSMQGLLSRYLEQSVMIFLQQQELYQRRMRDALSASPLRLVQRFADQNISFWRGLVRSEDGRPVEGPESGPQPPVPDFEEAARAIEDARADQARRDDAHVGPEDDRPDDRDADDRDGAPRGADRGSAGR